MPFTEFEKSSSEASIGIWELTERHEQLLEIIPVTKEELHSLNTFTHERRKAQWLAARVLLSMLLPGAAIHYDENGKPFTATHGKHISISHSGNRVVMMVAGYPCGVDIETIRQQVEKIAPRFLSPKELPAAMKEPFNQRLHAYWCVKEAIYKVYGKKGVSLRTDIFVDDIAEDTAGIATATLVHGNNLLKRQVHFERDQDYMLAWTLPDC